MPPAARLEWVAAGYGLTTAVFLITAGRVGDRIGRRRTFALGMALFTISSIACGAAGTSEILIAGRLLQGVGGALLMTNLLSLIGVMFQGPDRAKALSAYGMTLGLAAVERSAHRRRARAGEHRRPRLAELLSHQRPDRPGRARVDAAGSSPSRGPLRRAGSTSSAPCSSPSA